MIWSCFTFWAKQIKEKEMKKRCFVGLIIVAMMLNSLTGCVLSLPLQAYENYEKAQDTLYVSFYNEGEEDTPIDYREIADYQSVYSDYNSRVMYNTLSSAEQQIYRFLEYAMDKECTLIFIDARLLADVELSLGEILEIYSMDTPMVQQNYYLSMSDSTYTFSFLANTLTFEVEGKCLYIENFCHEAMEKKKIALAEAEKVFATLPEGLSQLEQARFFYRYFTREVQYLENEADLGKQHNLYDAFVNKKTHCDGFSNAFALLCAMAKIPCVEKIYTPEKEDDTGHTWDVFCADGVWYNADMSLTEDYAKQHKELDVDFEFGFSDERQDHVPDMAERFPECKTDLIKVDMVLKSASDSKFLSGLKDAFKSGEKRYVYICLQEGEMTDDDFQKVANYLRDSIYTIDETYGGKNYYYIFKL